MTAPDWTLVYETLALLCDESAHVYARNNAALLRRAMQERADRFRALAQPPVAVAKGEPVAPITFDQLVACGIEQGVPCYDGLPWSFTFGGFPVMHENNDTYRIVYPTGAIRVHRLAAQEFPTTTTEGT